jgi:hypothetical protein
MRLSDVSTTIISVTNADIKHGERGQCSRCPVALAVLRRLECKDVTVGICGVTIYSRRAHRRFYPPSRIARWITDFDNGRPVKPTRFKLSKEVK